MAGVERRHWLLLATAVAGVSFSSVLVRYAQAEHVPPLVMSFYRLLFATLVLAPFSLRQWGRSGFALPRRDLGLLAVVGLFLAAHFATWVTSLEYTSVASSAVLVTTESLWVPLGTAFLLRERVGPRVAVGVGVAFAGSLVLLGGDLGETRFGGNALVGDFLAFAGALAASLYFVAGRRLRQRLGLLPYATIVYAFATLVLFAMVVVHGDALAPYTPRAFLVLFLFALFPMIVGHTLINYVLRWIPPHYASTALLAEPVVSAGLAFLLLGEAIRTLVWVGALVIVAGLWLALSGSSRSGASGAASTQGGEGG